jgi:hypothetical protein
MSINPTKLILGLLTPLIAAGSAWLAAAAAKHGMNLDPSGVNALAVAGATAGAGVMVKLIHDVEAKPGVAKVVTMVEKDAGVVDGVLVAGDPKANETLEDAVAEVQRAAEARFRELEAKIPQPPAPAAPEPAPPAPVAPASAAAAPEPVPPAA